MILRLAALAALFVVVADGAGAVSLREVIRACGDDGKTYCPKVGYGQPMQDCLIAHEGQLGAACKGVVGKLKQGERVTLF